MRTRRDTRILIRTNPNEAALFAAASNLEPLASWARKSLIRSARRQLKVRIGELELMGNVRADKQIVQLANLLESVEPKKASVSSWVPDPPIVLGRP